MTAIFRTTLFPAIALCGLLLLAAEPAHADQLLKDGQRVIITVPEGPLKGKYLHVYSEADKTFGPTRVLSHDATSLTFRGRRDTCTMTGDGKVLCRKIADGTWKLQ